VYFQSLNFAGVSDMRTPTEIYQGATPIDCGSWSIHFFIQYPAFELIVLKTGKIVL